MTAYGAVISLKNTIDYILHSSHITLVEPSQLIIQAAYNELELLQEILRRLDETRTSRSRKKVNELDGRIKEEIWEFEDKLESLLHQQILPQFPAAEQVELTTRRSRDPLSFSIDVECLHDNVASYIQEKATAKGSGALDMDMFKEESRRITPRRSRIISSLLFSIDVKSLQYDVVSFNSALKEMEKEYIYELENMPQEPLSTTIGFDYVETKSKMIGFSDQFQQVKGYLMKGRHRMTNVHQIIGTAGIGKTTLAKELYEDADIVSHFDCRAWVTVTRTMVDEGPQFDDVIQGIVAQLYQCGNTPIQGDDQNIADFLEGKKCLIVLDDVWEQQVLDSLEKSLQDFKIGLVYVLITTRGMNLLANRYTEARFLNEEESKELLCHKVFGDQHLCPPQLDKAAAKIAKKCEGLPLTIVTVANILSKSQNTEPDYWNDVAEERNSVFKEAYDEISEVLFPSYDYLPQYLKMPFLFMGVFPPDYEIPLSKLTNMLNAEGWFLATIRSETLKASVCHCLFHLCMSRYLVLFKRKSFYRYTVTPDSIFKTCWLHSSWRYVCRGEARKSKLYHALHKLVDSSEEEVIEGQRGLCLQNNILFGIKQFSNSIRLNCAPFARSLLFFGPYHQYPTPIDVGFRLLRELDALQLRFYTFPTEILTLVQLKYLALTCNGELPTTISKLFNLRVLIVHPHMSIRCRRAPSYVPIEIWDMQELEHIEILGKSLRVPNNVASLENLLTLVGVNASISTILELSSIIPNIRKLGVRIELMPYDDHDNLLSCFACIATLESLEILKCSVINPVIQDGYIVPVTPSSLRLPQGLTKLHLSGTGFPWEYMDAISSLPSLRVLKLRSYAFQGSEWDAPQEGMFPMLRFLLIEDSDLVCLNLSPNLTRVSMKHCYKLKRIHWPSGYLDRKIDLVDCNPLALSWAKELKPSINCSVDVTISSTFEAKPMIINFKRYWTDDWDLDVEEDDDEDLADTVEDEKVNRFRL